MGGQTISVVVGGIPGNLAPSTIQVIAWPQGAAMPLPCPSVASLAGPATAAILFSTPPMDLEGAPSAKVNFSVIVKGSSTALAAFQYNYILVLPSVTSFSPTKVSDTGGDTIFLSIAAFLYPISSVAVQYGDDGTFLTASIDTALSTPSATFLSFVTPAAPPGAADAGSIAISLFSASCALPCANGAVTISLAIFAAATPVIIDPGPTAVPWQRLARQGTFSEIRMGNLPKSVSTAAVYAHAFAKGAKKPLIINCTQLTNRGDGTVSVWLGFPSALEAPGVISVAVVVATGFGAELVCPPFSLELYDAALLRVAGLQPAVVSTSVYAAGRKLNIRPQVKSRRLTPITPVTSENQFLHITLLRIALKFFESRES